MWKSKHAPRLTCFKLYIFRLSTSINIPTRFAYTNKHTVSLLKNYSGLQLKTDAPRRWARNAEDNTWAGRQTTSVHRRLPGRSFESHIPKLCMALWSVDGQDAAWTWAVVMFCTYCSQERQPHTWNCHVLACNEQSSPALVRLGNHFLPRNKHWTRGLTAAAASHDERHSRRRRDASDRLRINHQIGMVHNKVRGWYKQHRLDRLHPKCLTKRMLLQTTCACPQNLSSQRAVANLVGSRSHASNHSGSYFLFFFSPKQ